MQSYLFVGEKSQVDQRVAQFLSTHQVFLLTYPVHSIEDARALISHTTLSYGQDVAFLLSEFDQASEQAQQALLKTLEEATDRTFFLLTAATLSSILPTILSRCQIEEFYTNSTIASVSSVPDFFSKPIGQRLLIVSKLTTRESALDFVSSLLSFSRDTSSSSILPHIVSCN
jgi:replication-associated recombination protein RarA